MLWSRRSSYQMDAGYRTILFFFVHPVGRVILGLACLIGGIYYGLSSRSISYQQHILTNYTGNVELQSSTIYIQDRNTHNIYITSFGDFDEFLNYPELDKRILSLTYDNASSPMNIHLSDGQTLQGSGYHVLKIDVMNDNGVVTKTFATKQFKAHPTSYYDNHWIYGSIPILLGLFLLSLTFIFPPLMDRYQKMRGSRLSEKELNKRLIQQTSDPWNNNSRFREPPDFHNLAR